VRKIHRAIHFDFHTMPGIHNFGRGFDAAVFAQRLADAHVDYINFFAHCNLGFAYYPTKLGIPYPTMRGDLFGDVLRECHKRHIGVTAYINVGLMHEQLRLHPEWCRMDKEGRIYRDPEGSPNFFRTACYNNPGYRDFLLGLIREICTYDIDGLFCDCMHFFPCHCDQCTRDMAHEGVDMHDEKAVEDFSRRVMLRISREIKDIAGSNRYLYLNGMPYYEFRHLDTHAEIECLPSDGWWGYDYFGSHAAYARTIHDVCLYMTGRFQASWGDFGGYKGRASLENDVYDALCNAYIPSVGDHLHPAENINEQMYQDIGAIYERVKQYETYTEGARYCADIGVLTASTGPLGHEYAGLARMLGELKSGFNILNQAEDFSAYRLVILPEGLVVDDALAARLKAYLDAGGRILCTGTGGLTPDKRGFALPEALTYVGEDASNSSYFTFVNLPQGTADMPWSMYQEGILMTAKRDADVRARYVKPYFNKHWDGMHYYFYTPPERQTEHAAAAVTGGVGRICFGIFTAYFEAAMREHKLLVQQLIDELLPEPLIRIEKGVPSTARVTATGRDDYLLVHVKATFPEPRGKVAIVEEHVTLPAGAVLRLRGEHPSVVLLPVETPIDSRIEDGYTIITLPAITGYAMLKAASSIT
jgi:hypothetical protein